MSNSEKDISIFSILGLILLRFEGALFPPAGRISEYGLNSALPNVIPDINTLSVMAASGYLSRDNYFELAKKQGFDTPVAKLYETLSEQRLQPEQYIILFRRGLISAEFLKYVLQELKYTPDAQILLQQVTEFFPSPPDLIRFAVREVYSTETAKKFGQFEDLPDDFLREASKTGLPESQARNYWAAHWELPSAGQGFEMYHRRIIDRETLSMLLKSLDVMPFWRDKLIQMSYNPLTRVDVRRMYGLGVLDEQGVYNAYLDAGYSPENAEKMTSFTVRYENSELEGITRANLIMGFKRSIINEDELRENLIYLGLSDKSVEFWVTNAIYENFIEDLDSQTDDLAERYQMGSINIDDVRNELNKLDVPSKFVDDFMRKTVIKKSKRTKVPAVLDLIAWKKSGIITADIFIAKMRGSGYAEDDIGYYLKNIKSDAPAEK